MKILSQDSKQAWHNPWVVGWVAGIVIVISVNAAFIITAASTNPGLVEADYYEKGRDHERNFLARRAMQNRLEWQMDLQLSVKPIAGTPARVTFSVADKAGVPVTDSSVTLKAYRPSDASADFQREMAEIAPGLFSTEVTFGLKGIWDLTATVSREEDNLDLVRRISVSAR